MRTDEVEKRMQALLERRAETEQELRDAEARLAELEEERNALSGTLALRRRAVEDLTAHEQRLREELAAAKVEEAQAALTAAIKARDTAVGSAAKKVRELKAAHDLLEQRRREVEEAVEALGRLRPPSPIPTEPDEYDEEWRWWCRSWSKS